MSFKENLKGKIKLNRIFQSLVSTTREPPGRRWLDKDLSKELLAGTDFEYKKARGLHLYVRPLEGEIMEVAVLDNELPIYHTTVDDVTLRKSPYWQQMFSIRNVRKIMNDHDVIASKGKESLKRLHSNALALLDLTYTRDDLAPLLEDARRGLERKSIEQIQERNPCISFLNCWVSSLCLLSCWNQVSRALPGQSSMAAWFPSLSISSSSTKKTCL